MTERSSGVEQTPTDTDAQPDKETTDSDLIDCCPECNSSNRNYRTTTDDYLCLDCRAVYDEPDQRPSYEGLCCRSLRLARTDPDDVDRGDGIETDGGRDSPKGDLRITLNRDDINALLKDGTSVVQKDVGPITVNVRTHQQLNAVVTVSGRQIDPDPERVDE